jgi:hypothetical protein
MQSNDVFKLNDILVLNFQRGDAMQTYWNIYLSVFLAFIAFFGTVSLTGKRMDFLATIMSGTFVAFAGVNLTGLYAVCSQRVAAKALLVAMARNSSKSELIGCRFDELLRTINPPSVGQVMLVQLFGDAVLLAFIWSITIYTWRSILH